MKQLLIAFMIMVASSFTAISQDFVNISGQVTNTENGAPLANHEVMISMNDSLGYFVTITDQLGYYETLITFGGMNVTSIYVYTLDCDYFIHDTLLTSWDTSATVNFQICDDTAGGDCEAMYYFVPDSSNWQTVYFFDMSYSPNGNISSWYWEFGDGSTSTAQNPVHTYDSAGVYPVCLSIEDNTGNCENTFCMDIEVGELPWFDCQNFFTAVSNDLQTYTFTGEVNVTNPTSYEWDFGDGTFGSGQQVTHTYDPAPGMMYYIACLTTFSVDSINDTCVAISCQDIYVGNQPECQAMYWYMPDSGSMYSCQFFDASFGNPTSWTWEFGDGITSSEQNPLHTYQQQGTYLVCLSIEGDSCQDTFCDSVWVGAGPEFCQANFYFYPNNNTYNSIQFIDMSYSFYGPVESWYWEFGDGTTSTEQNPEHNYNASGDYEVCLTISDSNNICTDTFCMNISISGPEDCEAMYYYYIIDSMGINNSLMYYFVDASTGYPETWLWDFGDGTTSTEQNPEHSFSEPGTYTVCLTIENDSCTDTYCANIDVMNWPGDCFSWFEYTNDELVVSFDAFTSSLFPTEYIWYFGDNSDSLTGQSVTHTYETGGLYTVSLISVDSTGCTSQYLQEIWVGNMQYNIWGTVYAANNLADQGYVYLMTFDTLGNNLVAVDTAMIDSAGTYLFQDIGINNWQVYYVQAELSEQ